MKSDRIAAWRRARMPGLPSLVRGAFWAVPLVATTNAAAQAPSDEKSIPAEAQTQPEPKPTVEPPPEPAPAVHADPAPAAAPGESVPQPQPATPGPNPVPASGAQSSAASKAQPGTIAAHEDAAKKQAAAAEQCLANNAECEVEFEAGDVYHPFDKNYWLLGLNYQKPNRGGIFELEASYVPWISDELSWLGFWGSGGIVTVGTAPSEGDVDDNEAYGRGGAGVEFGWRMLAADVGVLGAWTPDDPDHGFDPVYRVRAGLALAQDLSSPKEGSNCCPTSTRCLPAQLNCECDRTPHGMSLFVYYSREYAPDRDADDPAPFARSESMFGVSLKYGFGR